MQKVNYQELMRDLEAMLSHDIGHPEGNILTFPDVMDAELDRVPQKGLQIAQWDFFNKATDGLRPNEFSILCGPSGAGKTTLLANIYAKMISQNVPCFAAPVEVGPGSFARKVGSIMSGMNIHAFNASAKQVREKYFGLFFSNELMLISKYGNRVNHKILLCDLLHAHRTRGTKVALIDNLNFMLEPSDKDSMILQYDRVIHDWVVFLKQIPIHVFMVMHPRKTDGMRVEHEGDIKGSSTAIQEAQNVLLFNRLKDESDAPMDSEPKWCREIKIAKVRENGRFWGQRILFSLDKVSEKYEEKGFL